jgi:predicted ribosomally synthesized peptide with nif11-like leader
VELKDYPRISINSLVPGDPAMSVETVRQFWQRANQDPALQKKLGAVEAGAKDAAIAEVILIAKAAGFAFTQADYETAVKEELSRQHAATELGEDELAAVAGGNLTPACSGGSGGSMGGSSGKML